MNGWMNQSLNQSSDPTVNQMTTINMRWLKNGWVTSLVCFTRANTKLTKKSKQN